MRKKARETTTFSLHLNRNFRNNLKGYAYLAPAVLFIVIVSIYPLFDALRMSFYRDGIGGGSQFAGFSNYSEFFASPLFLRVIANTLFFTFISVFLHAVGGMFFALILNSKLVKHKNFWRSLQFLPWLFPSAVVAAIWTYIYQPQYGILLKTLHFLGLSFLARNWLGDPNTALGALSLANGWVFYPFFTLMFLAAMQNIPGPIYEAAEVDGAVSFQAFFRITLPLLKPVILTTCLLDSIWTFRFFDLIWITTKGGPLGTTELLSTHMYKSAFLGFKMNYGAAVGGVLMALMLVLVFMYLRAYRAEDV